MIDRNNVYYVYPNNDLEEHLLQYVDEDAKGIVDGNIVNIISCNCKCEPRIVYENDIAIVVHRSFDGREALEEAMDILKQAEQTAKKKK